MCILYMNVVLSSFDEKLPTPQWDVSIHGILSLLMTTHLLVRLSSKAGSDKAPSGVIRVQVFRTLGQAPTIRPNLERNNDMSI